jgi:hypothetical protein
MNSKLMNVFMMILNPTVTFQVGDLSTGQKMRRNLLYDIKRSEQMASLFDKNDDVELWP